MNELDLKVTVDEANLILEALGQMPFKQVYALVGKIQEQANQQLSGSAQSGSAQQSGGPPAVAAQPEEEADG